MQTMFHKLSMEIPLERRQYEAKIAAQEEELRTLRAALNQQESHQVSNNPEMKKKVKIVHEATIPETTTSIKKLTKEINTNNTPLHTSSTPNLSALMRPTTSSALHAKPKINMSKVPKAISATKVLTERKRSNSDQNSTNSTGNSPENHDDDSHENSSYDEEDDSQYQSSSDGDDDDDDDEGLDESFFPDEELSDMSDEEMDYGRRFLKEASSSSSSISSQKKRSSKELDQGDEESQTSQKKPKIVKSKSSLKEEEDESVAIAMPTFPLSKYKVPELKKYLSDRSLPVSGMLPLPTLFFPLMTLISSQEGKMISFND